MNLPAVGSSSIRFASIGRTGGLTARFTPLMLYRARERPLPPRCLLGHRRIELGAQLSERRRGPAPRQFIDRLEQRDVGAQRREGAEQQSALTLASQSGGQGACPGGVYVPVAPVAGDRV